MSPIDLTPADAAIADYLDDLRDALGAADVPRPRRRELVADIEAHISAARAELDDPWSEAEVRTVLERLGAPELIAADEAPDELPAPAPAPPAREPSWRAPAAIVLLLFGGLAFGVGWLAGLILLWSSPRWTVADKLAGTVLWPGGLAGGLLGLVGMASPQPEVCADSCASSTSVLDWLPLVLLLLVPFLTAGFLAVRLRPAS